MFPKFVVTKQQVLRFVLLIWLLFSIGYIARDQWLAFATQQIKRAYEQGFADSVRQMLSQTGKCTPISVYEGDKRIELIEISCLDPKKTDDSTTHAPTK